MVLSGTLMTDFRETGIWAEGEAESRGRVEWNGSTRVQRTGSQNGSGTPSGGQDKGTGLFLHSNEGYLGFFTSGTIANHPIISDNWRDGIHLIGFDTDSDEPKVKQPMGTYVDMGWAEVRGNREDGIHFLGDKGIVGSTWVFDDQFKTHILSDPQGSNPNVQGGWGLMNGCMVHNNTAKGLRFELTTPDFGRPGSIAAVRIFNTYLWNNGEEAFYADGPDSLAGQPAILLAPMIHCTVAGNGDSMNQDVEIPGGPGFPGTLENFKWTEDGLNSPGTMLYAHTKFFDTILERKSSNAQDLGSGIQTRLQPETGTEDLPGNYQPDMIYLAGLRATESMPAWVESTTTPTPFAVSPPVWTSADVTQFFLDVTPNSFADFDLTPTHLGTLSAMDQADFDILGKVRADITTGKRDKGGRENN